MTRSGSTRIDFYDVDNLCRHLATAAFIVIAYLTGMRERNAGHSSADAAEQR